MYLFCVCMCVFFFCLFCFRNKKIRIYDVQPNLLWYYRGNFCCLKECDPSRAAIFRLIFAFNVCSMTTTRLGTAAFSHSLILSQYLALQWIYLVPYETLIVSLTLLTNWIKLKVPNGKLCLSLVWSEHRERAWVFSDPGCQRASWTVHLFNA